MQRNYNHNTQKSSIFKNSIYNIFGQLVGYLFLFLYTIIFAKILGAELFGLFQLGLLVAVVLATSVASFVESTASYFVAFYHDSHEKRNVHIVMNLFVSIIIAVFLALGLYLLSHFFVNQIFNVSKSNVVIAEIIFKYFSLYLFFYLGISNIKGVLLGLELFKCRAILIIFSRFSFLLFGYIGFYYTRSVIGITEGIVVASFLTFILALIILKKNIKLNVMTLSMYLLPTLTNIWDFGKRSFIINIGNQIHTWGDSFLIGIFLTASSVGIYSVAYTLFEAIRQIPRYFYEIIYPILTKLASTNDKQKVSFILNNIIRISCVPLCIVTFFVFIFSENIILTFYGSEYNLASTVLQILSIIFLFLPFMVLIFALMSINKPEINSKCMMLSTLLNIILNLLFIPIYGINGAALATLFSMIIYYILTYYQIKKYIQIELPINDLIKNYFLILVIFIIYRLLESTFLVYNLFISIILIIAYIVILFVSRFFTEYDCKLVREITGLNLSFLPWSFKK
ncbi:polysaccharide biosynthesis C-terminal domain-containing protein [Methanococcoides methylutens]|uniref:Uncharacterized protein n=1 Tax=Methanococcoides methylutens MM1 TaxID=1434104 RepID=A0A0E3X183_METMT|nr:polysaccharide biosynthesis C-terminal domain-containing protein [Methanococcoides methylutens]AKB86160.1 hypothetical protein MCMEM_2107 [Methanococcoides methylutens MM1]